MMPIVDGQAVEPADYTEAVRLERAREIRDHVRKLPTDGAIRRRPDSADSIIADLVDLIDAQPAMVTAPPEPRWRIVQLAGALIVSPVRGRITHAESFAIRESFRVAGVRQPVIVTEGPTEIVNLDDVPTVIHQREPEPWPEDDRTWDPVTFTDGPLAGRTLRMRRTTDTLEANGGRYVREVDDPAHPEGVWRWEPAS